MAQLPTPPNSASDQHSSWPANACFLPVLCTAHGTGEAHFGDPGSTAFLALGFGAVNGQDFRTRRDPLGRFTLFLISQLVSGSRVSLTQGRAGPAGVETAGREHGSCNHAVGE